jgi:outer membrane protein W
MRKPLVLLTLALPALTASPLLANLELRWPPAVEVSVFGLDFDPSSAGLDLQPGFHIGLDSAPGFGAALSTQWNDTLSTRFMASYARPGIRLSGSAAASGSGGDVELVPLSLVAQLRAHRFTRVVPYVEGGITYLLASSSVKPALAAAGVTELRRPDHIALLVGAGLKVPLRGPWTADLDVTYRPFAQSLFVVGPTGVVDKEEKVDVHAVAAAVGFSYRF